MLHENIDFAALMLHEQTALALNSSVITSLASHFPTSVLIQEQRDGNKPLLKEDKTFQVSYSPLINSFTLCLFFTLIEIHFPITIFYELSILYANLEVVVNYGTSYIKRIVESLSR